MLSEVADVCMIPASNANFFATLRHAVRLRVSSGLESDRSREDIYNERVLRLASWGGRAVGIEWWSTKGECFVWSWGDVTKAKGGYMVHVVLRVLKVSKTEDYPYCSARQKS
jgi:hypothetical protein